MDSVYLARNVPPPSTGMRQPWDASLATPSASAAWGPPTTSVTPAGRIAFFSVSHVSSEGDSVFPSICDPTLYAAWCPSGTGVLSCLCFTLCLEIFQTYRKNARVSTGRRTLHMYPLPTSPLLTFPTTGFGVCLFSVSVYMHT